MESKESMMEVDEEEERRSTIKRKKKYHSIPLHL